MALSSRNEQGDYIGNTPCVHHKGVERIEERTCCGGRVSRVVYITCQNKGIILAKGCGSNCKEWKYPER
jgi:hypothetical protein